MKDCWYVSLSIRFAIDRAHRSEAHAVWKRVFWCGVVGKNKLIDRWGDENKDITRRTPRGLTASWKPAPIKSYRVHSCLLDSCSICHRADGALWKRWVGIYDNDGEKIHCVLIFGRAVGRLSVGLGWVGQLLPLLIRSRGREGCVTGHIQQHTCIMSLGVSKRPPTLTASDLFLFHDGKWKAVWLFFGQTFSMTIRKDIWSLKGCVFLSQCCTSIKWPLLFGSA